MGGLQVQITGAPLRTVRPRLLRDVYANPEKELVRLRDAGRLVQIARGTYMAKPDDVAPNRAWQPRLEVAAMAYATAVYGDHVPVLFGIGAARFHHAIPRAINVTVVAVPASHREVRLLTGGRVVFTVRDATALDARPEQTELGPVMVTTPEQTLVDLIRWPDLGGIPAEAGAAILALRDQVDTARLVRLLERIPATARIQVEKLMEGN